MKLLKILLFTTLIVIDTAYANTKLADSTMNDIEIFSKKKLDLKNDLAETIHIIKILLVLDEEDPSRTAVILLSESYNKNPLIFEKAIQAIKTNKNKKQLNEIESILKNHYKSGNG